MIYSPYYEIYLVKKYSNTSIFVDEDHTVLVADQPANYIPKDFQLRERIITSENDQDWVDLDLESNALGAISITQDLFLN